MVQIKSRVVLVWLVASVGIFILLWSRWPEPFGRPEAITGLPWLETYSGHLSVIKHWWQFSNPISNTWDLVAAPILALGLVCGAQRSYLPILMAAAVGFLFGRGVGIFGLAPVLVIGVLVGIFPILIGAADLGAALAVGVGFGYAYGVGFGLLGVSVACVTFIPSGVVEFFIYTAKTFLRQGKAGDDRF